MPSSVPKILQTPVLFSTMHLPVLFSTLYDHHGEGYAILKHGAYAKTITLKIQIRF